MNNTQKWLKRTSGSFPKIVGYFVGNEVLSSWIKAIGYDIERGVKHGGALFIEFFRNETNGTAYIRLFLKSLKISLTSLLLQPWRVEEQIL